MKLFLHTDALLDCFASQAPHYGDMVTLRQAQLFGDVELWASAQSYIRALQVLSELAGSAQAKAALKHSRSFIKLCGVDGADMWDALDSDWPEPEAYAVARGAAKVKADYIISRDTEQFPAVKQPVLTPRQFLSLLREQYGYSYEEIAL